MQVQDIHVGKLYRLVDGYEDRTPQRVINVFFNEDWQEYCVQARAINSDKFSQAFSFLADDFKEAVQ
jgi:hypothetical protein